MGPRFGHPPAVLTARFQSFPINGCRGAALVWRGASALAPILLMACLPSLARTKGQGGNAYRGKGGELLVRWSEHDMEDVSRTIAIFESGDLPANQTSCDFLGFERMELRPEEGRSLTGTMILVKYLRGLPRKTTPGPLRYCSRLGRRTSRFRSRRYSKSFPVH